MATETTKTEERYALHIARTDGVSYDVGAVEESQPLDPQDQTLLRWKVQLGHHLKNQLAPPNDERLYMLADLPEGYELRVYNKSDKSHWYLYGHPLSLASKFRTPGDFVPHLLWLASQSPNRDDCSCEFCKKMVQNGGPLDVKGRRVTPKAFMVRGGLAKVFRVGELVWYKHTAWRLGVIASLSTKDPEDDPETADDDRCLFVLTPLGHRMLQLPPIQKEVTDMRPYLTFSVPAISANMHELLDKSFVEINWLLFANQFLQQEPDMTKRSRRREIIGLEASKMAAKYINDAFSTFNRLSPISYQGMFLGAEQIRVGDPVRVTNPNPADKTTVVMLVAEILALPGDTGIFALQVKGDIYRPDRVPLQDQQQQQYPNAGEGLGPAFAQEIEFRTRVDQAHGMRWVWAPVERAATRDEENVLGRFYVTDRLMPIIDPANFQSALQSGQIRDATTFLNNRMHSGGSRYVGRKSSRRETLGDSVNAQITLPEGIIEEETTF